MNGVVDDMKSKVQERKLIELAVNTCNDAKTRFLGSPVKNLVFASL